MQDCKIANDNMNIEAKPINDNTELAPIAETSAAKPINEVVPKDSAVDVQENELLQLDDKLLDILLKDRTTNANIMWCTDDYAELGAGYGSKDQIMPELITGDKGEIIRPRAVKSKEEQLSRTREKAEVMTPTWICNKMNNLVDEAWFERAHVFNEEADNEWTPTQAKIEFPKPRGKKSWMDYLAAKRLEITCGEAPYLVSRYDTVTGAIVPLERRIGLLDRKLHVINERVRNFKDTERAQKRWYELAKTALQSIYGFEWQGDNILLARENLLFTLIDYYKAKFNNAAMPLAWLENFANIISWNIWQMDGIKCVVPETCHEYKKQPKAVEPSLFDNKAYSASVLKRSVGFCDVDENEIQKCQGCIKDNVDLHNGVYSKIKNWSTGRILEFKDLLSVQGSEAKVDKNFKFDVVIGNPPYQDVTVGEQKTFAPPIYNLFLEEAYKISDKVMMIHPARFLFNAGSTPKAWNKKMLEDEHLKVVYYAQDSSKVFSNTDIKGGVAITYHDTNVHYGALEVFTAFPELNSIMNKTYHNATFTSFSDIVITRTAYRLTDKMHEDHPEALSQLSNGHPYDMSTNIFDRLPQIFYDKEPNDGHEYVKILGRLNNERAYKYIRRDYINDVSNLDKYKLFIPKANGTGAFGEVLTLPVICEPKVGGTESFVSIGLFDTLTEADNSMKYIKTKFLRTMLGIVKITQDLTPDKCKYIPLQDFSSNSDIDWSKPIPEIDKQLYKKYGLSEEEINFIETKVKPME